MCPGGASAAPRPQLQSAARFRGLVVSVVSRNKSSLAERCVQRAVATVAAAIVSTLSTVACHVRWPPWTARPVPQARSRTHGASLARCAVCRGQSPAAGVSRAGHRVDVAAAAARTIGSSCGRRVGHNLRRWPGLPVQSPSRSCQAAGRDASGPTLAWPVSATNTSYRDARSRSDTMPFGSGSMVRIRNSATCSRSESCSIRRRQSWDCQCRPEPASADVGSRRRGTCAPNASRTAARPLAATDPSAATVRSRTQGWTPEPVGKGIMVSGTCSTIEFSLRGGQGLPRRSC